MKQTAVEWLLENLISEPHFEKDFNYNSECWDKAKAMEKEQIIEAIKLTIEKEYYEQTWANCRSRNHMAEQYYNETYESTTKL